MVIPFAAQQKSSLSSRVFAMQLKYVRDRTWDGMNAGVDLWTLMQSIKLPPELAVGPGARQSALDGAGHMGRASWLVSIRIHHRALPRAATRGVSRSRRVAGGPNPCLRALASIWVTDARSKPCIWPKAVLTTAPKSTAALALKLQATELLLTQSTRRELQRDTLVGGGSSIPEIGNGEYIGMTHRCYPSMR